MESRGVKAELDHGRVVDRAKCNVMCSRSDGNACGIKTNLQSQHARSGGRIGEQAESEVVEGDWRCKKALNGGGYDGECTRSQEDKHGVETNAHCQDTGPGGQLGEQGGPGDVKDNWKCWSDAEGDKMSGG